jgi:hypothetical protein
MPYFIYQIETLPGGAMKRLDKLAAFASFKEASAAAKKFRAAPDLPPGCTVKVMFAENELQAEDLLSQPREPEPMIGDDY